MGICKVRTLLHPRGQHKLTIDRVLEHGTVAACVLPMTSDQFHTVTYLMGRLGETSAAIPTKVETYFTEGNVLEMAVEYHTLGLLSRELDHVTVENFIQLLWGAVS